MRAPATFIALLALTGCANTPPGSAQTKSEEWAAYRRETMQERDQGKLSPVEAEAHEEIRFRELFGPDPVMEGAFAYSDELLRAAEAGQLPIIEAEALAQARQDEILARRDQELKFHDWMESRFPSEPSD